MVTCIIFSSNFCLLAWMMVFQLIFLLNNEVVLVSPAVYLSFLKWR